jgi:mono/diheme cytochrome c family protein
MSRTNLQITLGIILVIISSIAVLVYGFNENKRMEAEKLSATARSIEHGADLFDSQCSRCHGKQGLGIQGLCPPLNDRYFFDQRLKDVGWSGSQEDYIIATASSGRLASTRPQQYPGNGTPAMPSFSERYGGPLRDDQINDIAAFIMNWKSTAQLVQTTTAPAGQEVGTNIQAQLPKGDPTSGEKLAVANGCTACHIDNPTGPPWKPTADQPGIGDRAAQRINQAGYTGKASTADQYLFESIVNPSAFLVPNFADIMPKNFGTQLTAQQTADLIAYLLTIK